MSYRVKDYERFIPIILALPLGTFYGVDGSNVLTLQAEGAKVLDVWNAFPEQEWKAEAGGSLGWEYRTELPNGILICIYADRKGPLKAVRKSVWVLAPVAVQSEAK